MPAAASLRIARPAPRGLRQPVLLRLAAALLAAAPGCSRDPDSRFPERDYSGEYAVVVTRAENDCRSQGFARGDSLTLILHHAHDNRATAVIPPIATLQGAFSGDRFVARAAVEPPALPPAPAASGEPADGGAGRAGSGGQEASSAPDSIRYVLDLAFEEERFEGDYRIDQPAIPGWLEACSQRFALRGEKGGSAPSPIPLPVGGP